MGKYIEQADIENVFGEGNVLAWSDLGDADEPTIDTDRIALAIAWAEARVENRFRHSRYTVPFEVSGSAYDSQLKHWCAVYAGHWLYSSRDIRRGDADTGRTDAQIADAEREIAETLAGQSTLDVGEAAPTAPTGPVVIERDMRVGADASLGTYNPPYVPGGSL